MNDMTSNPQPVALITGASRGLGRALAETLAAHGWRLVLDARDTRGLVFRGPGQIVIEGDVTDAQHRTDLAAAVDAFGRLDLLVNNASDLGPSPLPRLADLPLDALRAVLETNVIAPVALVQLTLPLLRVSGGCVLDLSSDAAVEAYAGWGGYGGSKAALDQLSAVLGVEEPELRVYAMDPGDMRTAMHQAAFPGEDITDRPEPATVAPAVWTLLERRPPSGRYRAADLLAAVPA
jgi:NAD(P)-dependent dehydrogenase (short-subunit alcohol dehydrogenase family)